MLPDKPLIRLRGKERFDAMVSQSDVAVVVVWHYLCPACEDYKLDLRAVAEELADGSALRFGLIHLQLQWMIDKAGLYGDVELEHAFLTELGIGDAIPVTLRFVGGALQQTVVGRLGAAQLRALAIDGTLPQRTGPTTVPLGDVGGVGRAPLS